jgi:hypothetical protein
MLINLVHNLYTRLLTTRSIENTSIKQRYANRPDILVETLEKREVFAVSVALNSLGTLQVKITGSDSRQSFILRTVSSSQNKITYHDGDQIRTFNVNPSSIRAIDVTGSDRDNTINLSIVTRTTFPGIPDRPTNPAIVIRGNRGDDSLFGSDLADSINGGEGLDIISGRLGNDTLDIGSGNYNDVVRAGDGNDTVIAQSYIDDSRTTFDGEGGFNTFIGRKPIKATFRNFSQIR